MPYADTEESPMHPEKLLAGVAMAAMLACFAIAIVGRILGWDDPTAPRGFKRQTLAELARARRAAFASAPPEADSLAGYGHKQPSWLEENDVERGDAESVAQPHQVDVRTTIDLVDSMTFIDDESEAGGAKLAPTPVKPLRPAVGTTEQSAEEIQKKIREQLMEAKSARPVESAPPVAGSVFGMSSAAAYVESMRSFRESSEVASTSLSDGLSGGISSGLDIGNGAMEFVGQGFETGFDNIALALGTTTFGSLSRGRNGEIYVNRGSAI